MVTKAFSIEEAFRLGNYDLVVRETYDRSDVRLPADEVHWIVGALSFLGRVGEAQDLWRRFAANAGPTERIAARFFLAITHTRHGRYAEGRALFAENLRERSAAKENRARFFIEQGMGFYRYFSGRPVQAAERAELAHAHASEDDFIYGRVLALDLQGHALIESGEIALGLEILERARRLARDLGNGSVLQSLDHSLLLYRVQFGLGGDETVGQVETKIRKLKPEDTYTESSLLLELSRQYLWRGRFADARGVLDRAARVIYATQNRRHEILLNLRFAALLRTSGDPVQSLNYFRSARKLLHRGIDRGLELELIDLEFATCEDLGLAAQVAELRSEAECLLRVPAGSVAERGLRRRFPSLPDAPTFRRKMDKFGDLLDELAKPSEETIVRCVQEGYFGLLASALGIPAGYVGVALDPLPGGALFMDRGEVAFRASLSPQLRNLILQLRGRTRTKQALIEKIWGYTYHPLRHDTLVYQAMNQLRKTLGPFAGWIVTTEEGYTLQPRVEVRSLAAPGKGTSKAVPVLESNDDELFEGNALNLRQRKILRLAEKAEAVDVRGLVKQLRVSAITVSRDLSFLHSQGLLKRVGNGRSTQYVIQSR